MNISFDFDGTLKDDPMIQDYCAELIKATNHEVHVITRRYSSDRDEYMLGESEHLEVLTLTQELGIKDKNVHFTDRQMKTEHILDLSIDLHIDDDLLEVRLLEENTGCLTVHVDKTWRYYVDQIIGYNLLDRRYNLYEIYAMGKDKLAYQFAPNVVMKQQATRAA